MEVRIGMRDVAREISFESDESVDAVSELVVAAVNDGAALTLHDDKGRRYVVPAAALGYVQLGEPEKGRVGFGAQ
ncbi:MAG: ATP-binding protein [Actinomycetales bacterium]|nr:MAG: ATP-binding protein [Actinomycetales bacterium]